MLIIAFSLLANKNNGCAPISDGASSGREPLFAFQFKLASAAKKFAFLRTIIDTFFGNFTVAKV
jgi:hypothetical protein